MVIFFPSYASSSSHFIQREHKKFCLSCKKTCGQSTPPKHTRAGLNAPFIYTNALLSQNNWKKMRHRKQFNFKFIFLNGKSCCKCQANVMKLSVLCFFADTLKTQLRRPASQIWWIMPQSLKCILIGAKDKFIMTVEWAFGMRSTWLLAFLNIHFVECHAEYWINEWVRLIRRLLQRGSGYAGP